MGETQRKGPGEEPPENGREAGAETQPEAEAARGSSESETVDPSDTVAHREDGAGSEAEELRRQLEAREAHLREVYDELARARLAVDEAEARREAVEARARQLEGERDRLAERAREQDEEERRRGLRREGQERHLARLGREIERRDAEIRRLEDLLAARRDELKARAGEAGALAARREEELQEALNRIDELERDGEESRADADRLRAELDLEVQLRKRMAEPNNRLRAGIELFNESDSLRSVRSISRSMGQPEVRAELEPGGDEPSAAITFTWQGITWQTYHANPGLAVEEPRVYLAASGEDLSGVQRRPSNARVGPGGRVVLGL